MRQISEKFLKQEFHMHQLNSCQMGKFEKITIEGMDVKFSSFDMALENWQTAQTHLYHYLKMIEKVVLKVSSIDQTAWFTRLAKYIEC